jgi:hypothetical protein
MRLCQLLRRRSGLRRDRDHKIATETADFDVDASSIVAMPTKRREAGKTDNVTEERRNEIDCFDRCYSL